MKRSGLGQVFLGVLLLLVFALAFSSVTMVDFDIETVEMKRLGIGLMILLGVLVALALAHSPALAIDPPHTPAVSQFAVNMCRTCHDLSNYPGMFAGGSIDNTPTNMLCRSCHDGSVVLGNIATHSSGSTGSSYGLWANECITCHNPHYQRQFRVYGAESYLATGPITLVNTSALTMAGAGWTTDQWAGFNLIPNIEENIAYRITNNTSDTITVKGSMDDYYLKPNGRFSIVYGKLVRDQLNVGAPRGGSNFWQPVKLFNSTGPHSLSANYMQTDTTGVCVVCHRNTRYMNIKNIVAANITSHTVAGTSRCVDNCHQHKAGMAHGAGASGTGCGDQGACHGTVRSHPTHVGGAMGFQLDCPDCHDTSNFPYFKSGTDANADGKYVKSETDVCNPCHSPGGSFNGVIGVGDSIGAKDNWATRVYDGDGNIQAGKEKWCVGCHDNSPSQVIGQTAPNKAGDNSTFGFYVTGHGKESGNYPRLSWQDTAATGNPGANLSCNNCHDSTAQHINTGASNTRLMPWYENDQDNTNCKKCHWTGGPASLGPAWFTNSAEYEASAHKTTLCTACHDVHGSVNSSTTTFAGMTKGNKESLCFSCHTEGVVQNLAVSGSTYNNDIQQAFNSQHKHNLGTSFHLSGSDYTLECVSCHNVHLITGKYWDAAAGKSPITRFTDNLEVWGDEAGEKMDDYAANGAVPGIYEISSVSTSSNYFTGREMPDYPTFCLDCHTTPIGSIKTKNWEADPHGRKRAGYPGLLRRNCPNAYDCGAAIGWSNSKCGGSDPEDNALCWPVQPKSAGYPAFVKGTYDNAKRNAGLNYVLNCIDCHEAHGGPKYKLLRHAINTDWNGYDKQLTSTEGSWSWPDSGGLCLACHGGYFHTQEHMFWHNQQGYCSACNAEHHPNHLATGAFVCTGVCHSTEYGWGGGSSAFATSWHNPATFHENRKALNSSTAYDTASYDPTLVLDMRFEGNLLDSHMWNLHGHYTVGSGSYVTGKVGTALQVDNNPVEVGAAASVWDSTNLGITGNTSKLTEMKHNMTLETWIYPTSDPTNNSEKSIISKHNYWSGGYRLVLRSIGGQYRVALQTNMGYAGPTSSWDSDQYNCNGLRGAYSTVEIRGRTLRPRSTTRALWARLTRPLAR